MFKKVHISLGMASLTDLNGVVCATVWSYYTKIQKSTNTTEAASYFWSPSSERQSETNATDLYFVAKFKC